MVKLQEVFESNNSTYIVMEALEKELESGYDHNEIKLIIKVHFGHIVSKF